LVLLCLVGIFGGVAWQPLTVQNAKIQLNEPAFNLALNPFESLFSTLPAKK